MKTVVCMHVESGRGGFVLNMLIAVMFSGIQQSYPVVAQLLGGDDTDSGLENRNREGWGYASFTVSLQIYSTVKTCNGTLQNGILVCMFLQWPFYTVLYLYKHFLQFSTAGRDFPLLPARGDPGGLPAR